MSNANQPKSAVEHNVPRIIIAAASARFLAASSLRAGYPVSTIDLFADVDTVSIITKSNRYLLTNQSQNFAWQCKSMDEILERLETVLSDSSFQDLAGQPIVLIGGGLERCFGNENISQMLVGRNNHEGLFNVLSWRDVDASCSRNSIAFPTSAHTLNAQQGDSQWLLKTEYSSGGLGVQFAQSNTVLESDQYFQRFIDGRVIGACYVAAPKVVGEKSSMVEMLGVCESVSTLNPRTSSPETDQLLPFRFVGSIGPTNSSQMPDTVLAELKRVGSVLAEDFGLVGVFGIDFVLNQDALWLIEVNPRIPASAELIEYAARQVVGEFSIVELHLEALSGKVDRVSRLIDVCQMASAENRVFAKKIIYRQHDVSQALHVAQSCIDELESRFGLLVGEHRVPPLSGEPWVTDVPKPRTEIGAGQPLLTVHVSGNSKSEVSQRLGHAFDVLEGIFKEPLT